MKFLNPTSLFLLAASVAASSDVVDLKTDSLKTFLESEKLSLVEFFAPWCGHCKALAPEYEKAATKLKEEGIKIAKIDCTAEADACEKYEVRGYPTLKVFRNGNPSEYKGARTSDSIIDYMKKQALPALSLVNADGVNKFTESSKVVILATFSKKDSAEFEVFSKLANEHRDDYVFGYVEDKSYIEKNGDKKVVLYKKFDEGKNEFAGDFEADVLLTFIKENATPLMDEIGPENYGEFVKRALPIAYLFYDSAESRSAVGQVVEPVAREFKGKISFVYIDAVKYGGHGKTLNLQETWPAFAIQNPQTHAKFPMPQPLVAEDVAAFVADFVAGKIEPSLKSEPEPATNDGPVLVVVGKSFEKIVLDKSKDVFVELYAPWCGHCKKLAPIWDQLGEQLKGSNVVIVKMDGTENDLPPSVGFQIEGFPTLKLFKADTNEIVDYEGDRTLDSLVEFLKTNAVHADSIKEGVTAEKSTDDHDHDHDHEEL